MDVAVTKITAMTAAARSGVQRMRFAGRVGGFRRLRRRAGRAKLWGDSAGRQSVRRDRLRRPAPDWLPRRDGRVRQRAPPGVAASSRSCSSRSCSRVADTAGCGGSKRSSRLSAAVASPLLNCVRAASIAALARRSCSSRRRAASRSASTRAMRSRTGASSCACAPTAAAASRCARAIAGSAASSAAAACERARAISTRRAAAASASACRAIASSRICAA